MNPLAIMPPPTIGPMERAAKAAKGHCEVFLDGTIKASPEWFYNYSRLLLQGACEARGRKQTAKALAAGLAEWARDT